MLLNTAALGAAVIDSQSVAQFSQSVAVAVGSDGRAGGSCRARRRLHRHGTCSPLSHFCLCCQSEHRHLPKRDGGLMVRHLPVMGRGPWAATRDPQPVACWFWRWHVAWFLSGAGSWRLIRVPFVVLGFGRWRRWGSLFCLGRDERQRPNNARPANQPRPHTRAHAATAVLEPSGFGCPIRLLSLPRGRLGGPGLDGGPATQRPRDPTQKPRDEDPGNQNKENENGNDTKSESPRGGSPCRGPKVVGHHGGSRFVDSTL